MKQFKISIGENGRKATKEVWGEIVTYSGLNFIIHASLKDGGFTLSHLETGCAAYHYEIPVNTHPLHQWEALGYFMLARLIADRGVPQILKAIDNSLGVFGVLNDNN